MCHFITLIVATGDVAALTEIMAKHGRAAMPIDNPSIRKVLRDGECQYLTTRAHCDCGTVLSAHRDTAEETDKTLADDEARMRRKGWSEAKIARAMDDRRKAEAKPKAAGPDSFDLWEAVLLDVQTGLKLPYAGLFVRSYSGAVDSELFKASRREVRGGGCALATIKEDEVTIFC